MNVNEFRSAVKAETGKLPAVLYRESGGRRFVEVHVDRGEKIHRHAVGAPLGTSDEEVFPVLLDWVRNP